MDDLDRARRCADFMYARDEASRSLGIEVEIPAPGESIARMWIRDDMVNGFELCHGGLLFALADTAFAFACNAYNRVSVAASAQIEFIRPVASGDELLALAREEYRGKRGGYYRVEVRNQRDELVALFRGRSATRDQAVIEEF